MDRKQAILVACLALALWACSDPREEAASRNEAATAGLELPLPTTDRQLEIAHRGVRRVEVYTGGASPALVFREAIVVAGDGSHFGLEPIEALSSVPADWIYREHLWARFSFRYRDFAVRDTQAFLRNWRLTDLAQDEVVAGRTGARYLVERIAGEATRYELVVDRELGLVLSTSKYDAAGGLVLHVEYESLEEQVDLETAVWTEPAIDERILDPAGDLRAQVGADVPLPLRIPAGYELREASTARFDDRDWLRLVYDDGVEPVFFLSTWSEPGSAASGAAQQSSTATAENRLVSARLGAIQVVQTVKDGEVLMGVGSIGESSLADLVESALP